MAGPSLTSVLRDVSVIFLAKVDVFSAKVLPMRSITIEIV